MRRFYKEIFKLNEKNNDDRELEAMMREMEKESKKMNLRKKTAEVRKLFLKTQAKLQAETARVEKLTLYKVIVYALSLFFLYVFVVLKLKSMSM